PAPAPSALQDRLAAHVSAAAEHQHRLVGIGKALDMADEDDVVAAVMAELVAALEMRRRADQHRRPRFRDDVADIEELVVALLGELVRQLDLVPGEDVDDEMRPLLEGGQALRVKRAAPQHQRRVQRHRGERVRRHAVEFAVAAAGGDDRYAGGEGAERVAQLARVEALGRGAVDHRLVAAGMLLGRRLGWGGPRYLLCHEFVPRSGGQIVASGDRPRATRPYIAPLMSQLST